MVDVQHQIEAVTRALTEGEVDGEPAYTASLTQTYPSPVDDVWEALTVPERIARWFLPISGELRPDGRYQLEGASGGRVLECDPPADGTARYRVTWEMMDSVSWVEVRLEGVDGGSTRVELSHTALRADAPDGFWETYGPGATGVGWDGGMLGLSLHLGAVAGSLAPEETEAWAGSDEGRDFYRGAADAWAQAHIASGADPESAARAADETFAFFTGTA